MNGRIKNNSREKRQDDKNREEIWLGKCKYYVKKKAN